MSCILQYVNYTSMELSFESFNPVCPESAYITPCYACVLNHFSRVWLCESLCTVAFQAPLCMGFSRHEYLSGLPYSVPGDLPNPGIKPASLTSPALAGGFFIPRFRWGHVKWPTPPRITQPKGDRSTFILFCKKCFLSLYTGRFDLLTNLSRDTHCSSAFQATMRLVSSKLAIEWSLGQCTYFPSKHLFFSFRWFF